MYSKPMRLASEIRITEVEKLVHLAGIGEQAMAIAHEARSPLITILLGLNYCRKLNLPEPDQKRISLALEEAERLQRLLNDLLSQTKSSANFTELQSCPLELNSLINEILTLISQYPEVVEKKLIFASSISIAWIQGDRDKLKQVFINLIINACEAIAAKEEVIWEIAPGTKTDHVCIQIHNNGEPISPQIMSSLGTSWVTTKPNVKGLGLAIVKQIVEAHKGELTIISAPNRGTTVKIELPLLKFKNISASAPTTLKRKTA